VAPVVYPRYSSLPFLWGKGAASRRRTIQEQIERICAGHPGAVIDVFCHSNGTKLFAEVVGRIDKTFSTIVFAGSICRRAEAEAIASKARRKPVWNICGVRDRWPIIACALRPDLFEHTGVDGFLDHRINDRFHDFGHSGAREPEFIKNELVPLFLFGENTKGISRPMLGSWHDPATYRKIAAILLGASILLLGFVPWWTAAVVGLAVGFTYYGWHEPD
jgi:hypothetical protein